MNPQSLLKSIIIILAALISASCATSYQKPPSFMRVSVALEGDSPFCIYSYHLEIDGAHPFPFGPDSKTAPLCATLNQQTGKYQASSSGGTAVSFKEYKNYVLVFRRAPDGPLIRADFDLTGKLTNVPGEKTFAVTPVVTPTGVMLRRLNFKDTSRPHMPISLYTVIDVKENK